MELRNPNDSTAYRDTPRTVLEKQRPSRENLRVPSREFSTPWRAVALLSYHRADAHADAGTCPPCPWRTDEPWKKDTGRPKSCGLYRATEIVCMYLRQNATQEFIGDMRDISQPTVSRIVGVLVPVVKSILEEFVPSAAEAVDMVKGRVVLVDGTITPWLVLPGPQGTVEPQARDYRIQRAAYLPAERRSGLHFRSPAGENSRRDRVQGRSGQRNRGKIWRRYRGQGVSGHGNGHAEEETTRWRARRLRQRVQRTGVLAPRPGRAGNRSLQGMADIPYGLPSSLPDLPGRIRRHQGPVLLLDHMGF
jgi:hypothetical protein